MKQAMKSATILATGVLLCAAMPAAAQQAGSGLAETPALLAAISSSSATLPEAPSSTLAAREPQASAQQTTLAASIAPVPAPSRNAPMASRYSSTIPAGFAAQKLTARDKVLIGLHDTYSADNFLAIIFSAGYEHVTNGAPNYGTDRGAFGERLGAAGLRETSQSIFSESIFAPIFHQDPRYYVEGPSHNVVHRTLYAITRPLLTRTDGGRQTINASLLAGYAATAATAYAYYPAINQNAKDTVAAFGGSIGGAAFGFFVTEFSDDVLEAIHLKKKP